MDIKTSGRNTAVIECLLLFVNRYFVSLKTGSLSFYPFHITLSKFFKNCRQQYKWSGRKVCDYYTVSFQRVKTSLDEETDARSEKRFQRKYTLRADMLKALPKSVELRLRPLTGSAVHVTEYFLADQINIQFNSICSSYIATIQIEKMCFSSSVVPKHLLLVAIAQWG